MNKLKALLLSLLILIPVSGMAQGSAQRWYTALQPNTSGGNYAAVIPYAQVYVCSYNSQIACNTPTTIYSDTALTHSVTQPLQADARGNYSYYIQSGTQVIEKVCAPYNQCTNYGVKIGDLGTSGGTVTEVDTNSTSGISGGPITNTGTISCLPGSSSQFGCFKVDGTSVTANAGILSASGTSPLTTKGDLFGFSSANARIPIGTDGQVLTADSAQALGLKWAAVTTSGVQYNPTTTFNGFVGDSRLINSTDVNAGLNQFTPSSYTCNGTSCVVTGSGGSGWSVNDYGIVWWPVTPSCMQGSWIQVTAASSTTLTFPESQTQSCSGSISGSASGSIVWAKNTLVARTQSKPFFSGHGTSTLLLRSASGDGTIAEWDALVGSTITTWYNACVASGGPCNLFVSLGFDDLYASPCSTYATLTGSYTTSGSFRKFYNDVHAVGNINIITVTEPTRFSGGLCGSNTAQDMVAVNQFLVTLSGAGAATTGQKDYADYIIDGATTLGQMGNANYFDTIHYSNQGANVLASAINDGMAAQGSWNLGQPSNNGPNVFWGEQVISLPSGSSNAPILGFGHNNSYTQDFYLQNDVAQPEWYTAGNFAWTWRWNSGTSAMWNAMPNNAGLCWNNSTSAAGSIDTCFWRGTNGGTWVALGNTTKQNASGGLNTTNFLMAATAPTGACSINGAWQLTQDGKETYCSSGTWTNFSSGGTTTNALTINNSNSGDASGATFNGSAAKTISTNSIGAPNLTASNTFSGATTNDYSGTSQIKLPVAAGFATLANGEIGYDTTNLNWHIWSNAADQFIATFPVATPPTSGDCAEFSKVGNSWKLIDAGGACGVSGGGVTAFSGDGALLSNSASTGSVTATLANAAAHKFWGNNTGSSAAPGYQSIGAQDASPSEYVAGGGTANAQTATLSPAATSLATGLRVEWKPTAANSGAATLAVNGLTATAITKCGTTALAANDLTTSAVAVAVYDGTQFQLINPQATGCGAGGASGAMTNITASVTPTNCTVSGNVCTTAGAVASVTLASIPSGYNAIKIVMYGTSSAASSQFVKAQFNGDTGSNYDYAAISANAAAGPTKTSASAQTFGYVCDISATGTFGGGGEINIPQYTNTTFWKTARGVCGAANPTTSFTEVGDFSTSWRSTAAITSVLFFSGSGNISTGTTFVIYGIN